MQIFKAFMKVLKKKLPSGLIYIIVFLGIAIPMSLNGKESEKYEDSTLKICIFDEDDTPESKALIEYIDNKHDIVSFEKDKDVLFEKLYWEEADYALTINKGYSKALANGDTNDMFGCYSVHYSYATVYMETYLNEYVSSVRAFIVGGQDSKDAVLSAADSLSEETDVEIADNSDPDYPERFSSYFQYMPYILISVLMNTLCPVLMTLNRKDIRYRTNCSCVRPNRYTLQLFAGSTVFVTAVWLILMIAALFMYGGLFKGNAWLAVLNSFIFALVSTSIAVLVSSFNIGSNGVSLLTQIIGLGMCFLCGVFVPQIYLGKEVRAAANFLPASWYIKANDMLDGTNVFDSSKLATYIMIEVAFIVTFFIVALFIHRIKYNDSDSLDS